VTGEFVAFKHPMTVSGDGRENTIVVVSRFKEKKERNVRSLI
jgi:hypothetical protein